MKFIQPRLGVLAAICWWASATHAAGIATVFADGDSLAATAGLFASAPVASGHRNQPASPPAVLDSAGATQTADLSSHRLTPRARAFGTGQQLVALAEAWNQALVANQKILPGLHSAATAEVRRRFVQAPEMLGLFNVEEACLAVGCMSEFAFSPKTPDSEDLAAPNTVVPLPPALYLFASAVGLMGWLRRRVS